MKSCYANYSMRSVIFHGSGKSVTSLKSISTVSTVLYVVSKPDQLLYYCPQSLDIFGATLSVLCSFRDPDKGKLCSVLFHSIPFYSVLTVIFDSILSQLLPIHFNSYTHSNSVLYKFPDPDKGQRDCGCGCCGLLQNLQCHHVHHQCGEFKPLDSPPCTDHPA